MCNPTEDPTLASIDENFASQESQLLERMKTLQSRMKDVGDAGNEYMQKKYAKQNGGQGGTQAGTGAAVNPYPVPSVGTAPGASAPALTKRPVVEW